MLGEELAMEEEMGIPEKIRKKKKKTFEYWHVKHLYHLMKQNRTVEDILALG